MPDAQPCDCHVCTSLRSAVSDSELRALVRALIVERFTQPTRRRPLIRRIHDADDPDDAAQHNH
jgi:hypothetical protein